MFSLTNYVDSHHRHFIFTIFSTTVYSFMAGTSLIFLHHPQCLLHNMTLTEYFWSDEMNKLTNKCMHVYKYLPWLNTSAISIFSFSLLLCNNTKEYQGNLVSSKFRLSTCLLRWFPFFSFPCS